MSLPEGPLELGPPRRRAVLALLLVNAGKVVSTESLIRNIWGSEPPAQVVTTLRSYISRLRKLVAGQLLRGGVELQLKHRSPGYVLLVPAEHVDIMRFEALVRRGVSACYHGKHPEAFGLLSQALRGWDAPPFEDLAKYEFAAQEAARLGHLRLTALEECAEAAFALDRSQEVLPELEQEVLRHPMRERLVYQLMRAQYRGNRQADALYTFERTRKYLAEELGADVSPELKEVHEKILKHDPMLATSRTMPDVPLAAPRSARRPAPPGQPAREPRPAVPVPPEGSEPDPPVPRRRESERLTAALKAVLCGNGRNVLIIGEAGVGKTWLVQRFRQRCRESDIDVCTVYCPENDDVPPYWPWLQVLLRAVALRPEAVGTLPASVRRHVSLLTSEDPAWSELRRAGTFAFQETLSQVLLALAYRPLVLVLENFHRADPASLAMMRFLTEQTAESPLLFVVTSRSFRAADDPDWRATWALLLQLPNAEEIRIEALAPEESRQIVTAVSGQDMDPEMCAELHERSGGNPYLLLGLLEAVRGGMAPGQVAELLPSRLREVIVEQLSRLPPGVVTVLRACAVLGPENTMEALSELAVGSGAAEQDVGRAVRSGLLRTDPDAPQRIDFLQPLVRDVIRQETPRAIRAELHRRSIGLLARTAADPETTSGAIARHTRAALQEIPPADAIAPLVARAEHALHRFAYGQAFKWLSHAATLATGPADDPQYAEAELSVQLRRADVARIIEGAHADWAQAIFDRIEYLGRVLGRPQHLAVAPARLFGLIGRACLWEAEMLAPRLLELAASEDAPLLGTFAHLGRGIALHASGRLTEALDELDTCLTRSDVPPQVHVAGCRPHISALRWQAVTHWLNGEPKTARQVQRKLISRVFNEPGHRPAEQAATLYTDSVLAALENDAQRAIDNGRRALELSREAGLKMWWRQHQAPLAWAWARIGSPRPDVLRAAHLVVASTERHGMVLNQTLALGLLAEGERAAGRTLEAGIRIRQMHEQARNTGEVAYLPAFPSS